MSSRPLAVLLLALLSATGCTTVAPATAPPVGTPSAGASLSVDGAGSPTPVHMPVPVVQSSPRSALVRTDPQRPRRTAEAGATPRHQAAGPARDTPRVLPPTRVAPPAPAAPRHREPSRAHPHAKPHHGPAPRAPHGRPQNWPGQMRRLCREANGVASSGIVGLCRRTWG
ncbi:hypothetical protein [Streptomyces adustus]|uniref:hypothetical protein n=1 Tax=Streptomyces adustus TaxID=1609272 RepID=UPI003719CC1F